MVSKASTTCWLNTEEQQTKPDELFGKVVAGYRKAFRGLDKLMLPDELRPEVKLVQTLPDRKLLLEDASIRLVRTLAEIQMLVCLIQASDSPVVVRMCVESLVEPDKPLRISQVVLNSVLANSDDKHFRIYLPELKVDWVNLGKVMQD
mgnify:CR=1 FL=1